MEDKPVVLTVPNDAGVLTSWAAFGKDDQANRAEVVKRAITEGYINPLQAYEAVKAVLETCKLIVDDADVKKVVADDISKYSKKEDLPYGHKASVSAGGFEYDFDACGDVKLKNIKDEIKRLKELQKNREQYLTMIDKPTVEVDADSGETWTIHPPPRVKKPPVVKIEFRQ